MIRIAGLEKSYGQTPVLRDISLEVEAGEVYGIVGHSGAGKSTLLRCLNGLEGYQKGSVRVMGREVRDLSRKGLLELRREMGMIFQTFSLMSRKNVFQNVAFPLEVWDLGFVDKCGMLLNALDPYSGKVRQKLALLREVWRAAGARREARVMELLELVGLADKRNERIQNLSGGQKQRVGIARALALNPKILLCDEATSALDPKTTSSILDLLRDINQRLGLTIIMVTHQMEVVKRLCHRMLLLDAGLTQGLGRTDSLFLHPTPGLKKLIEEEYALIPSGTNIRLIFPRELSQQSTVTSMARELDINFSIVGGRLERYLDDMLGFLIINVDDAHLDLVLEYLQAKKLFWEVLDDA